MLRAASTGMRAERDSSYARRRCYARGPSADRKCGLCCINAGGHYSRVLRSA